MITGELKNKVDSIWDTIWTGGITSPITVLEQITYAQQQEFVKAIINYVRENGDISREDLIEKSPFDKQFVGELFGENISVVIQIVDLIHGCVSVAA